MKIFNVRLGLATNSSSSHSLIFLPNYKGKKDSDAEEFDFGWNYFTAATESSKKGYLAHLLNNSLRSMISEDMAKDIVKAWVGDVFNSNGELPGHIDHQSVYSLPKTWDGKGIDKEFFIELKNFFMQKDLVILGGNDNDTKKHPLSTKDAFTLELGRDDYSFDGVARKDPAGFWTIFNRKTGAKVRFSFDRNAPVPTKAYSPELVDIKITDFCPYDCAFCYQDSTAKGTHANRETMRRLASALGDAKVFEVAIGGGEPTLHPHFIEILEDFKRENIVPNFTTKNLAWLRDRELFPRIMEMCGSFAFSVSKRDEIENLKRLATINEIDSSRINIQYVMGSTNKWDFGHILDQCGEAGFSITLLGYKDVGRGSSFKPEDHKGWIKQVKEASDKSYVQVRIDTALAEQYDAELKENKVPEFMYHTKEGKFSLYVDAVSNKIGPSSYCNPLLMRRVQLNQLRGDQLIDMYRIF